MRKSKLTLIALLLVTFFANTSLANGNNSSDVASERNIQNLTNGIESENLGLKKHCIYFAGKYKISELTDKLIEQYKNENDAYIKKLILFSLYEIKSDNAAKDFFQLAISENDKKLKNIASAAYLELNLADSVKYYSKLTK